MWDMPIDGASDEKKIPHWFGNLAWVVIGGVFKLLFRYRVDGRENLRAFKGGIGRSARREPHLVSRRRLHVPGMQALAVGAFHGRATRSSITPAA